MKRFLTILFLFSVFEANSMNIDSKQAASILLLNQIYQTNSDSIAELILIRETVEQNYIKGLQNRDFDLIRTICIKEAKLYGVRKDSTLNMTTLDRWSKKFDPDNPPFKTLEYEIEKIDCAGTAAQVKILFIMNGNKKIYDFLNMLKVDGVWMIVNIIDY